MYTISQKYGEDKLSHVLWQNSDTRCPLLKGISIKSLIICYDCKTIKLLDVALGGMIVRIPLFSQEGTSITRIWLGWAEL